MAHMGLQKKISEFLTVVGKPGLSGTGQTNLQQ